jgi:hypothetical protein
MKLPLLLIFITYLFSLSALCQECGIAVSYQKTDNRYENMVCATAFGEIDLNPRWSARATVAYNMYYFKEVIEKQGINGTSGRSTTSKGTGSYSMGLGGFYSLIKEEEHFEVQIGAAASAHTFVPNAILQVWERFYRIEVEVPLILKYRRIANSDLGMYVSVAPGRIFGSGKHIEFEADLGKTINKLRFEVGFFYVMD